MSNPKQASSWFLILSVVIAAGAVVYARFLPWWGQALIILFAGGIAVIGLKQKRRWIQVLLALALLLSSWRLVTFQDGLDDLVDYDEEEVRTVNFLVWKDSPLLTLKDQAQLRLGISEGVDEATFNVLQREADQYVDTVTWSVWSSDEDVYTALSNAEIDVMVIDSSMSEALLENDPQFDLKTRVIWEVNLTFIKEVILKDIDVTNQPFIVLISGIDVVGPVARRQRSDVNILLVINPLTYSILMVPVARDSYLSLGCENGEMDKLTHAGLYGVSCSVKTIENFLDIDINYYVRLNFTSFLNLIDVLGSINVYSSQTFNSTYFGPKRPSYPFVKGMNVMDSKKALAFARERLVFEEGDVMRGRNQTELIKGIANKLMEVQTLTKIDAILETVKVSIDTNFPAERLNQLIRFQIDQNPRWNLTSMIMKYDEDYQPAYSYGTVPLFVVHPQPDSVNAVQDAIKTQLEIILP